MKKLKVIVTTIAIVAICGVTAIYFNSKSSDTKEDTSTVVSNKETSSTDDKKDASNTTKNDSKTSESNSSKDTASDSAKNEDSKEESWFCGKWGNAKRIQTGNVTADDGEGIDNIMKSPIEFKSSSATYNKKNYTNVKYLVENISDEEFSQGYRSKVTFKMLGISSNSVEVINIDNYDTIDTEENEITDLYGTTLYKKDNNTMIICKGGNFFELTRL